MKKAFSITLISICLMLSTALNAFARTYSADEIKYDINKQVEQNYKSYTDADIVSTVLSLPFPKLILPDGKIKVVVTSMNDKFVARDVKKVQILVDNKPVKQFCVPVEVKAYKNVLVASTQIGRDEAITPETVKTKKMEVSQEINYIITPEMLGKDIISKKLFRDGEIIDKRFVKLRPDVMKNNVVTAYFSSNNVTVEIDAVAMSSGMKGDYIGVASKQYGKVYTGKVIGENKVLIEL